MHAAITMIYNGILLQFRRDSLWWNLQRLCPAGKTMEEASRWFQEELESCKLCQIQPGCAHAHSHSLLFVTLKSFQFNFQYISFQSRFSQNPPLSDQPTAAAVATPYDKVDEEETLGKNWELFKESHILRMIHI